MGQHLQPRSVVLSQKICVEKIPREWGIFLNS
jgi:hypothetical protein